jgi:hypothetical protein
MASYFCSGLVASQGRLSTGSPGRGKIATSGVGDARDQPLNPCCLYLLTTLSVTLDGYSAE